MLDFKYKLVARAVADLFPYARNSRMHSEAQVAQIAASIKEFGFTNPVLIDETSTIIAGGGRVLGAQKLGLVEVPCIVLTGLSEAQKAAYVIADNKIALNAGWDDEMLSAELARIARLDFNVDLTGFDTVEIIKLAEKYIADMPILPADGDGDGDPSDEEWSDDAGAGEPLEPAKGKTKQQGDWAGMPEFSQTTDKPYRSIALHFPDQAAVDGFAALTNLTVTDKTKYLWYPVQVKRSVKDLVYE